MFFECSLYLAGTALTLRTVFNVLHSVSYKWFDIGLQLDVPISQLNIIETDRLGAQEQMHTMLDYWMNNSPVPLISWKALVNALKVPTVGESRLARELEYRYCSPEDLGTLSKRSEKPPFACGCGKCTFFTFMVIGCPKPMPSASSFPFLNPSEITPEQQRVLRGRLRTESKRINIQFQYLVSTTLSSLQKQGVTVHDFLAHLMMFGPAPGFDHWLNDLQKAGDISEVFMGLKDYTSFFNYHLIEHIINVLGTEEDKTELKKYKMNFQQYVQHRVYECPPQFGPVSKVGHADIFVLIDSRYKNCTLAEIEEFRQELSELLSISSQGVLRLCLVEKGSSQLTFQLPSFVQQAIFPLSSEQERALAAKGVIWLTCGEYQFQVSVCIPHCFIHLLQA